MKRSDKRFPAMLLIAAMCLSQSTGVFAGELSGSAKISADSGETVYHSEAPVETASEKPAAVGISETHTYNDTLPQML
ncbi:MAG: hypothetical protein K6E33_02255 [Lachnospiraceae bacterium]|nr:hypothetical protein [Lachnospiraceae bacterium]